MLYLDAPDATSNEALEMFMCSAGMMDIDRGCFYVMAPARALLDIAKSFCKRHASARLAHAALQGTLHGKRIDMQPSFDPGWLSATVRSVVFGAWLSDSSPSHPSYEPVSLSPQDTGQLTCFVMCVIKNREAIKDETKEAIRIIYTSSLLSGDDE